jgi:hypothetical protein
MSKTEDERYIRGCRNLVSDNTFGPPLGTCPELEVTEDNTHTVSLLSSADKPIQITQIRSFIINNSRRSTCHTEMRVDTLPKKPSTDNPINWNSYEYATIIFDCPELKSSRIEMNVTYNYLSSPNKQQLFGRFYLE